MKIKTYMNSRQLGLNFSLNYFTPVIVATKIIENTREKQICDQNQITAWSFCWLAPFCASQIHKYGVIVLVAC